MSDFLFRFRDSLSAANALILMAAWLLLFHAVSPSTKRPASTPPPFELTLLAPEIQPAPPQAPLAAPAPRVRPAVPRQIAPFVAKPDAAKEAVTAPAPALPPAATTPAPSPPPSAQPVAVPPPPAPAKNSAREAEAAYIGRLRSYLNSVKRYPTGREASQQRPTGITLVWFTLRRSGDLVEAGIETSSFSMLLDNAALTTVRRGVYPAFPEDAWAGTAQRRFIVELDFVPK